LYYCAISIQSFEWLNTWHEIRFQEKFTIAEIPVERRQFQARERTRRNIFFGFITVFFCVSIADELWFETGNDEFTKFHQFLNIAANLVDLVFFAIMILLFPRAARKYHRHAYL
jgi:hypothetical protein